MSFIAVISFHIRNLSCKMARYSPFAQAMPIFDKLTIPATVESEAQERVSYESMIIDEKSDDATFV